MLLLLLPRLALNHSGDVMCATATSTAVLGGATEPRRRRHRSDGGRAAGMLHRYLQRESVTQARRHAGTQRVRASHDRSLLLLLLQSTTLRFNELSSQHPDCWPFTLVVRAPASAFIERKPGPSGGLGRSTRRCLATTWPACASAGGAPSSSSSGRTWVRTTPARFCRRAKAPSLGAVQPVHLSPPRLLSSRRFDHW